MAKTVPADQFAGYAGTDLGSSEWVKIDQDRIDAFADATLDHQFIHVDPEKAALTPFGTTIAHGFLTLSLLPHLMADLAIVPKGTAMAINYGSDRVRFLAPVKVDSSVRATARLDEVTEKAPGQWLVKTGVTIEIEGEDKPALVAETLSMYFVA